MWPRSVSKEDLNIEYCRGSGAGGQNRNKRDTACRMTHIPTGISVRAEDQRTQEANKRLAFQRLAAKLVPLMKAAIESPKEIEKITARVRSYNENRNQVIDHRVPDKVFNYSTILDGDLDSLLKEIKHEKEKNILS